MRLSAPIRLVLGGVALVLATASCTRVTPHVVLPNIVLGEPSFFPTLEAYTATPIVGGNRIDFLMNGEEIFPAYIAATRAARKTITYAQYNFEEAPVGRELIEAMAERCRAGVEGKILLDAFGALAMPAEYADALTGAGCQVVFFRPLGPLTAYRVNNRNHRRILVVDGEVGFTGGSGVGRSWMGNGTTKGHWRDTDVRVEGPVVQYLQGAFAENWLEATGEVLGGQAYFPQARAKGKVFVQVVRSSPAGGSFAMYTTFLLAISAARHSIYITNPYFLPDAKMLEALIGAAERGVRVVVLIPGVIDHNIVRHASRRHFGQLLKAGIEIHEYRPALLHSKTMVIDGVWSTIGSTNLDNRSFSLNDELNLVIYDAQVGRRLQQIFADDVAHSRQVEYRRWARRGFFARILELIALPLGDQL